MTRVDYKMVDLLAEKYKEVRHSFIELHDGYIRWSACYRADVPHDRQDLKGAWRESMKNFEVIMLRSMISTVNKVYHDESKRYEVYLEAMGAKDDVRLFFRSEAKANEMFALLTDYVVGTI